MAKSREVHVHNAHPRLRVDRRSLCRLVHTLDAHAEDFLGGCPKGELSIAFLTDAALSRIHSDFLSDPSPTDVITFEGDEKLGAGGEICVSADTAASYALRHGRAFSHELSLYVVHGWLHLAGYDDLEPIKKRRMRAAEKRAMNLLEHKKALPIFSLEPRA